MKLVPRIKRQKTLPAILAVDEVKAIFNVTTNLKHKAILMTTYAAGLRVGEVAKLRVFDIDSKNMQILIKQGKGKKDRYSLLSPANLSILRQYWKQYQPTYWLFPGKPSNKPISIRTVDQCDECGHLSISYNSCRNRHCPKCQALVKEQWLENRSQDLLPVK